MLHHFTNAFRPCYGPSPEDHGGHWSRYNIYGGTYLHAYDIRTVATSASTVEAPSAQICFHKFPELESHTVFTANSIVYPVCEIEGMCLCLYFQ